MSHEHCKRPATFPPPPPTQLWSSPRNAARNPARYSHQWCVSLVCGWLAHQFSSGSWNGLWGRYSINYGEIGCNMPEVKPFWWESEMERKPNYKRVIYWRKEMCALPSTFSEERGADKPERWWQWLKRERCPGSQKRFILMLCAFHSPRCRWHFPRVCFN